MFAGNLDRLSVRPKEEDLANQELTEEEIFTNDAGEDADRIVQELESLKHDRELTHLLLELQTEGLQTLFDEFSLSRVINVFENLYEKARSNRGPLPNMFDVIVALEPDRQKRDILIDKILTDARKIEADAQTAENPDESFNNIPVFKAVFGDAANFARLVEGKTRALKGLNKRFWGRLFGPDYRSMLDSKVKKFLVNATQDLEFFHGFITELKGFDEDLSKLIEVRANREQEQGDELKAQAQELYQKIKAEMDRIEQEIRTDYEQGVETSNQPFLDAIALLQESDIDDVGKVIASLKENLSSNNSWRHANRQRHLTSKIDARTRKLLDISYKIRDIANGVI
jgi:ElaB/YqjD/DUF883 family membrane-anchored ribosome-binding protein